MDQRRNLAKRDMAGLRSFISRAIYTFQRYFGSNELNLIMLSLEQQHIIKTILSPMKPLRIGIFGSVSRNEQNEFSDIDILVDVKGKISLFDLIDAEEQLSEAL